MLTLKQKNYAVHIQLTNISIKYTNTNTC